ncbi:MAG: SEL1-like repeat protein [Bacteroidales bacterium]|nr:SEL1-like repeat protein [Bacteroidales bacterium]
MLKKVIFYVVGCLVLVAIAYLLKRTAKQKDEDSDSLFDLGYSYMFGEGVEKNIEKAIILLKRAAEQGYERAQIMLESINDNK